MNVAIPEAIQKGVLPRRSDYDILFYTAEKKYEYGPIIYDYFTKKQTETEIKRNQQLESVSRNATSGEQNLIFGLGEREKQIIEMRFGLKEQRPHTLDEIGRKFNITRERVRQIINKALFKKDSNYSYEEEPDYIKKQEERVGITLDKIIKTVGEFYGLTGGEINQNTRKREIVMPRQIAMYLIRDLMGVSFSLIGRIFNLDHTTILYAFEKIMDGMNANPALKKQIESIKDIISSSEVHNPKGGANTLF